MSAPTVSFVVPCYKLAALLPTCLESILGQSYTDFEVLVMDDCSPDDTAGVVRACADLRVRHVRNDPNLGHLRNYNRGIELSRGTYVWLISADDFLRSPRVLERYVATLERHPSVGYAFCPGYGVRDGVETRVLGRLRTTADRDRLLRGEALLDTLLLGNFVLTPSGLVRRSCYREHGMFRLDLPWCGDWYLWCLFALHHDVAYFAEPMVCYREQHALSMTEKLTTERLDACGAEELRVVRLLRDEARRLKRHRTANRCLEALAHAYARIVADDRYKGASSAMNLAALETSLANEDLPPAVQRRLRARICAQVGSHCQRRGDRTGALTHYARALADDPLMPKVAVKMGLAALGRTGHLIHRTLVSLR